MILKIRRPQSHCEESITSWTFFDNIKRFDHFLLSKEEFDKNIKAWNYSFIDYKLIEKQENENSIPEIFWVTFNTGDPVDVSIVFNTIAYLCNDEGKTIERLN